MTVEPMLHERRPAKASAVETTLAVFDEPSPSHSLTQRSAQIDGRTYRLFFAIPKASPPQDGFPILYGLDGNAVFDFLDASALARVPGLIVAGVGHDTTARFDPPMRSLDYTPDSTGSGPQPDPDRSDRMIGGADAMLERLLGPLHMEVEKDLVVDTARRSLFGHSLAGLFTIYALLARPAFFAQYMAASPSIWWRDAMILDVETRARKSATAGRRILVTLGDSEKRSSLKGPHWNGPAPHTLEMIRRLEQRGGIEVASRILPGLGHAATLPASLPMALGMAATDRFPEIASEHAVQDDLTAVQRVDGKYS